MGGKASRDKGQRGEREIIRHLQPILDRICEKHSLPAVELERNLLQAHKGGHDIHGLEWASIEVKNQATLAVESWWTQTISQMKPGQVPILLYKKSRGKWHCRMPVRLQIAPQQHELTAGDVDFGAFLRYFEKRATVHLLGLDCWAKGSLRV